MNEVDLGLQYHLCRYAWLYEATILSDGTILAPQNEGTSIRAPAPCRAETVGLQILA